MIAGQLGHAIAALSLGWLVLAAYRYVARRSKVMGAVVAIAIVLRAGLGVALFWISYLHLPIAQSLQVGGGFWQPALDATGYYQLAARAADAGTLFNGSSASPFYVDTLALWMTMVGISPAAGMFLNLCLYAVLVVVIVWLFAPAGDWHRDLPCIVGVGAYSFAPVILFHSTQPLKEELFSVSVAVACLGAFGISGLMNKAALKGRPWAVVIGTIAIAAAMYGGAGIRWYYPFIIWGTLAVVVVVFTVRGRTTPLPQYLSASLLVLLTAWLGFWAGSGSTYWALAPDPTAITEFPSRLLTMVQVSRTGFLSSGGGTNIVAPLRSDATAGTVRSKELALASNRLAIRATEQRGEKALDVGRGSLPASPRPAPPQPALQQPLSTAIASPPVSALLYSRAVPVNIGEQLRALATGLGIVFVPLSVLKTILGIEISGGQGLLSITDIDTIYMDVVMFLGLALLWKRRQMVGDRLPFVIFGLTLSAATALLLGYVVTNYGTLWRMRPLVAIPVWVLAVALSQRDATPASAEEPCGDAAVQRSR